MVWVCLYQSQEPKALLLWHLSSLLFTSVPKQRVYLWGRITSNRPCFKGTSTCYPRAAVGYLVAVSSHSHPETQNLTCRPETRRKIHGSKVRVQSRKVQCQKWLKQFEAIVGFGQFYLHFLLS